MKGRVGEGVEELRLRYPGGDVKGSTPCESGRQFPKVLTIHRPNDPAVSLGEIL